MSKSIQRNPHELATHSKTETAIIPMINIYFKRAKTRKCFHALVNNPSAMSGVRQSDEIPRHTDRSSGSCESNISGSKVPFEKKGFTADSAYGGLRGRRTARTAESADGGQRGRQKARTADGRIFLMAGLDSTPFETCSELQD
ncbi:unnamed protein product [Nesidiocoris tenuis]|uniref:Uncharacterized protein n=1 Tax=Nesidiocoris tenuis TaxID=355587 RepID=A0A6H5HN79_9HEMI|nr:unnamed protein product [Nesidiocoris tenuis]